MPTEGKCHRAGSGTDVKARSSAFMLPWLTLKRAVKSLLVPTAACAQHQVCGTRHPAIMRIDAAERAKRAIEPRHDGTRSRSK